MIEAAAAAGATVAGATTGFEVKELAVFAGLIVTIATGATFWAVKWLMEQHTAAIGKQFRGLDGRFDALEADLKKDKDELHRVERDFMQLKADLPVNYLRKEDAIRHEAVVMAKLDALAAEVRSNNKSGKG